MKGLPDAREAGKWVDGDGMVIGFTIFIEHRALRISLRESHLDSSSPPGKIAGLMTLCGLCAVGPG